LAHDPEASANWNAEPLDVEAWLNPAGVNGNNCSQAAPEVLRKPIKEKGLTPTPVIRTAADATHANVWAKALNKDRFITWATERGFKGDLRTLDLRKLLEQADMVRDDRGDKIFVDCPWADHHTTTGKTDVVVFHDTTTTAFPWTFHCSHDHCSDKDVTSLLDHLEQVTPGCVDAACAKTYERNTDAPSHNDAGRADRFVERHGRDIRFVPEREVWLTWDKDRWRLDTDGAVERLAVGMSQEMLVAAGKIPGTDEVAAKLRATAVREALACGDRRNIADFIHLARINHRVLLPVDTLDADPWIVGAKNWLMDLRTGMSRAYTREDFVTRPLACAVDPNATCPRWEKFMEEVFPDEAVRHFVHKAVGYTLTGDMREQVFFFLHGVGRNGKSVFVRTLEKYVFGKLSVRAGRGITATTERGGYPATEVAELAGARMILTSETEQGQKLNENVIKDLSGGDAMRGRNLYENAFTFLPVGKLWIVGNHKPTIRGTDGGIWRRVRLIPFTQKFEGDSDDRQLPDKLAAEASGIFNWAVRGCLLWQQEGLEMPDVIREAVNEYQRGEDKLADFIEDTATACRAGTIKHADLFKAYQRHCEDHGNRPWTSRALAKALRERGWRSESTWESKCVWVGYAIAPTHNNGEPF
jgi:P4 family phage/plasmid primase-like protien